MVRKTGLAADGETGMATPAAPKRLYSPEAERIRPSLRRRFLLLRNLGRQVPPAHLADQVEDQQQEHDAVQAIENGDELRCIGRGREIPVADGCQRDDDEVERVNLDSNLPTSEIGLLPERPPGQRRS